MARHGAGDSVGEVEDDLQSDARTHGVSEVGGRWDVELVEEPDDVAGHDLDRVGGLLMRLVAVAVAATVQADEMRRKRRQRAQEKGAQATLKMMLPMVGCIFPTLWIVLLGPAVLILMAPR